MPLDDETPTPTPARGPRVPRPSVTPRRAELQRPWLKWLLVPLGAAVLLITVQAWNAVPGAQQGAEPASPPSTLEGRLSPTAHPAVPATLATMWYAGKPEGSPGAAVANFARGVQMLDDFLTPGEALPLVSAGALAKTPLAGYSRYYTGVALQRLNRLDEADAAFEAVAGLKQPGQLPEAALYRRAEIRETRMDFAGAAAIYERLLERGPASPAITLVKLGVAYSSAGDRPRAIEAYRRVLREFTLAAEAAEAETLLDRLGALSLDSPDLVRAELDRADALFAARKWEQARRAFERVGGLAEESERDRVTFRLAQIQAANGQHRAAREVFRRFVGHAVLAPEALHGAVMSTRALGESDEFKQLTDDFVARYPRHPLAEQALNELARYYVLTDDDGKAAEIYSKQIERFPSGALAERAAWKAGWWAYRTKNFRETLRVFERGAAKFPRSDYRPSWLYWSARSAQQAGDVETAIAALPAGGDRLSQLVLRPARREAAESRERGDGDRAGVRRRLGGAAQPAAHGGRIAT